MEKIPKKICQTWEYKNITKGLQKYCDSWKIHNYNNLFYYKYKSNFLLN